MSLNTREPSLFRHVMVSPRVAASLVVTRHASDAPDTEETHEH